MEGYQAEFLELDWVRQLVLLRDPPLPCQSVSSYEEEVGHIIEDLEQEVRADYHLLLTSTDETSASKYRAVLLLYSEARSDLDSVHIKLASDQDEKHQKRTIVNGLAGITNKLTGYAMI